LTYSGAEIAKGLARRPLGHTAFMPKADVFWHATSVPEYVSLIFFVFRPKADVFWHATSEIQSADAKSKRKLACWAKTSKASTFLVVKPVIPAVLTLTSYRPS